MAYAAASNSEAESAPDLSRFLYDFDVDNQWSHFRHGPPTASSVERGRRKTRFKMDKRYSSRKQTPSRRKNAAYRDVDTVNLVCCNGGCLLKNGIETARQVIRQERGRAFYRSRNYNEQNYVISKLMQVELFPSGRRKITYSIPALGPVCKIAFMKCYGVSPKKIKVLLEKMDCDCLFIDPDKRGRHSNRPRKLTEDARRQVTEFICSHSANHSHYRRARTEKQFFDTPTTMRRMWGQFTRQHPNFTSTRLGKKNKGPVISFTTFRNVFNEDLGSRLGFRKPREDTCQVCDKTLNTIGRMTNGAAEDGASNEEELQRIRKERQNHLIEGERRYAALKYDMFVLSKKRVNGCTDES